MNREYPEHLETHSAQNTHAALSDTIARIDSLEMARSGDMERWGKAMEDVDQLKRSEELQVDTLFELWYYVSWLEL